MIDAYCRATLYAGWTRQHRETTIAEFNLGNILKRLALVD